MKPTPEQLREWIGDTQFSDEVTLAELAYAAGAEAAIAKLRGDVELPPNYVSDGIARLWSPDCLPTPADGGRFFSESQLLDYGDRRAAAGAADAIERLREGGCELPESFPAGYIAQTEYFYTKEDLLNYGDRRAVAAIPPGYMVVPVEPTSDDEPKHCGNCAFHYKDPDMRPCDTCTRGRNVSDNWDAMSIGQRAMLEAAPKESSNG